MRPDAVVRAVAGAGRGGSHWPSARSQSLVSDVKKARRVPRKIDARASFRIGARSARGDGGKRRGGQSSATAYTMYKGR